MKNTIFCLMLLATCAARAVDAVYQWSVEVPEVVSKETGEHPRAYLWIPETCERLKGVVVGNDNMLEETLFGHADFRRELAAADLAIVFVQSGFQGLNVKCDAADAEIVFRTLARLGEASGYDELGEVPVAALGHSAWADWPYFMAFAAPERMFAAVSLKGSWPHVKPFKESFAERLHGVPTLLVGDEYSNCERFLAENAAYYEAQTNGCFKIVCDWGAGHFDYTPELPGMLGVFLSRRVAEKAESPRKLDTLCASATSAPLREKQTALMGFRAKSGEVIEQNPKSHLQITIPWEPEADGLAFTLDPVYLDTVPPGRPEGWTGKKAGEAVSHPADPSAIEVDIVQGSGVKVGRNRFRVQFNRRGFKGYRARELVIKAVSPAQDGFKRSVQQAILRFPLKIKPGRAVHPDGYYVREGAATVDAQTGAVAFLPLPPRAKRPHAVTVVAWEWDGAAEVRTVDWQPPQTGPQVRLLASPFRDNAMRERAFMESLDPRALTRMFRVTAGLATLEDDAGIYQFLGGWEAPDMEIRGHTCGHWLSGMASLYELTGDERVKARAAEVVHILAECQAANGNGYLGAFPETDIDKIIAGTRVWAPWYVLHKILAGLIDQWQVCGNAEAGEVARKFGDWAAMKVLPLTDEQRRTMLRREFGGIGESLSRLAQATGDERYAKAAAVFREDDLYARINGRHANTLIPKVIADVVGKGGAASAAQGENKRATEVAPPLSFWRDVTEHYMYAPGCVSEKEAFRGPDRQGNFLTGLTGETCCTYNLLKLSRLLWTPERPDIADYEERAVWNHILGQMEPIDGRLTYFMPVMTGAYKLQSRSNDSFWCCVGSAMESHTKYQRLVCEEADGALYINNFIPAEIKWRGLTLRLETKFPAEESARLVVTGSAGVSPAAIYIRRPFWSFAAKDAKSAKSFYEKHEKVWKVGDEIEIDLPCNFRTESVVGKDGRRRTAVFYGPLLMAARLGVEGIRKDALRSTNYYDHDYTVPEHLRSVAFEDSATWRRVAPPPAPERGMDGASPDPSPDFAEPTFLTPSGLTVAPFWAIHGERFCIYFGAASARAPLFDNFPELH